MTEADDQFYDSSNGSPDNAQDSFSGNKEPPSKSELKRRQNAIQDLIGELIALPKSQIDTLVAAGNSFDEIQVAASMAPSSARNRQIRYITKLISKDPELRERIKLLLEDTQQAKQFNANQLHQAEHWRETILAGDDQDIFEFFNQFGGSDQQKLRQLRREFLKLSRSENLSSKQLSSADKKRKEISRKVFKLVSENIRSSGDQEIE